ncbi:unnamed protein product [Discosporangium mesarthrocarpum]
MLAAWPTSSLAPETELAHFCTGVMHIEVKSRPQIVCVQGRIKGRGKGSLAVYDLPVPRYKPSSWLCVSNNRVNGRRWPAQHPFPCMPMPFPSLSCAAQFFALI